ncbi:MAG: undecaprenyldiphospho-muramoylpentapeptide beta-N-acetylglucosaminyltransferase [Candidatus Cloacimonetes bacterium 4572_55]|nr:MAG: undecaprenyldiphospho-muramoylpentapeptide beta-N-acetylglucosaminyltransferase [Candidatus Cloacimonetes bacterium 4572_55]
MTKGVLSCGSKKIALTGGGSAGHVTPIVTIIPELLARGYELHYIGTARGIERVIIKPLNIAYHPIPAGKLRRYFSIKNLTDIFRVIMGCYRSWRILSEIKPHVIFSKGGFVSVPVIAAAWLRRVPIVIHESDMTPGLANRISLPFVRKVCYTFPETAGYFPLDKRVLTGIPISPKLLQGDADQGRKRCRFTDRKPVIMVIGGSLGSRVLNRIVRQSLSSLSERYQICHICGNGNLDSSLDQMEGYCQFEFVDHENKMLADLFAAADLVVSRAGATILFELLSLAKPNLLIPLSKKASRGDQIRNARSFQKQGYSKILPEEDLTQDRLIDQIEQLYRQREMFAERMKNRRRNKAVNKLIDVIEATA